jgi:3-hydroxy-9,10-secoandrosta-1,3,5(10)-triene-9,17-dione monooxygenase
MTTTTDTPAATTAGDLDDLEPEALRVELVARAAALVPLLAENAAETEADRRVVEENITAIRDAGLFRIMVPRRFGGLQTDIRTKLEVSRELAKGCGSTAWVTALLNVCAWIASLTSEQCQRDIWADDPDARVAGVFDPSAETRRVDGGWMTTGRWGYASGIWHADWCLVGVPVTDEQGEMIDQGLAFVPKTDISIDDTWFVAGMKGTGSNTIVADDVFVPEHRVVSVPKLIGGETATPYKDEALYRSAFVPVAALILVGVQLGLSQAALDFVVEKASKRGITYTTYERQTDAPTFQLAVARAASLVDTAHLHAYRAAADIDDAARDGRQLDYTARARVRMDTGRSAEAAREAIRILCSAHGAASFADVSPLQRWWRDSEIASRHAVVHPEISAEVYGRALLGMHEGVTPLV